jgi:hypothetical protein
MTWAGAESFCKDNHTTASLVSILSDYENDFVSEKAAALSAQVEPITLLNGCFEKLIMHFKFTKSVKLSVRTHYFLF